MTKIFLYYKINPAASSRTLRLCAASDFTGEPVENFTESTGAYGKPYFPSHPDVHFSVSHTGGIWVCAFASREVGCDVQDHRTNDDPARLERLAKRWFSDGERQYLAERGYAPEEFYRIWSRKEAYVKFTGDGIGGGKFPQFDVTHPLDECMMRDIVLPYAKKHAAAVVCAEAFHVEYREL
ncbi:MAG: 4'-phosphopantetheinyl transferase superfamily protein [Clostridia bacterium]|nr:4'-phosphopantetheinyl transferase superfamily protein [Clostridia bacterium]